MKKNLRLKGHCITGISWAAKGAGLVLLLLIVAIFIGEGPPNPLKLRGIELIQMVNFLIALVGLALALWRQGIGGVFAAVGILLFVIVETIEHGKLFTGTWFLLIGLIGILNIFCWWLRGNKAGFGK